MRHKKITFYMNLRI